MLPEAADRWQLFQDMDRPLAGKISFLIVDYFSTLEEKFCFSVQPCNNLYLFSLRLLPRSVAILYNT